MFFFFCYDAKKAPSNSLLDFQVRQRCLTFISFYSSLEGKDTVKPQTRFKWSPDYSCLTAVTKLFIVRLWVFINTQTNSRVLWGRSLEEKLEVPLKSAAVLKGPVPNMTLSELLLVLNDHFITFPRQWMFKGYVTTELIWFHVKKQTNRFFQQYPCGNSCLKHVSVISKTIC